MGIPVQPIDDLADARHRANMRLADIEREQERRVRQRRQERKEENWTALANEPRGLRKIVAFGERGGDFRWTVVDETLAG